VPVVAVDADSSPNLGVALGLGTDVRRCLPTDVVVHRLSGPALRGGVDELLADHAAPGSDGLRLLTMGAPDHAGSGCLCAAHAVVGAVLAELATRPRWLAVVDLEASPEHLSRATVADADVLLVVAEPYYRSLEAARLLAQLARELPIGQVGLVLNKARTEHDAEAAAELCSRHGIDFVGTVPFDPAVGEADRRACSVVDVDPGGSVLRAVARIGTSLGVPGAMVVA
jgi:CO dehydrogenase maturation factor